MPAVRILGVDCGSLSTGYGVIDSDGARHLLVSAGSIDCSGKLPLAERLEKIGTRLRELISEHRPECAAVEEVFHSVNPKSAITLAHVRGVALFVLSEARLPVGEYSPATIKSTVTGFGRAEKGQVQYMVRNLLGLTESIKSPDAADALAVAVCHAVHQPAGALR